MWARVFASLSLFLAVRGVRQVGGRRKEERSERGKRGICLNAYLARVAVREREPERGL